MLPRRQPVELATVLPRFSTVAFGSVGLLILTGSYQAWREAGTGTALLHTSYGRIVLAKVALLAVILVLANRSRTLIQQHYRAVAYALDTEVAEAAAPVDAASTLPAVRSLRRGVLAELGLAAVILALTSVLVSTAPGRSAAAAQHRATVVDRSPVPVVAETGTGRLDGSRTVTVSVTHGGTGSVAVLVAVDGGPTPQQVTVAAELPARHLGPLPFELSGDGPSRYKAADVSLPAAGNWIFHVTVQTSSFDATVCDVTVAVRD